MNKKARSFITTIITTLTICSIFNIVPAHALVEIDQTKYDKLRKSGVLDWRDLWIKSFGGSSTEEKVRDLVQRSGVKVREYALTNCLFEAVSKHCWEQEGKGTIDEYREVVEECGFDFDILVEAGYWNIAYYIDAVNFVDFTADTEMTFANTISPLSEYYWAMGPQTITLRGEDAKKRFLSNIEVYIQNRVWENQNAFYKPEAYLRRACEKYGLDFETILANPKVKAGWYKNTTGKWYYSENGSSWITESWKQINGKWYYFDKYGIMVTNTTIDGYRLGTDGAWIK